MRFVQAHTHGRQRPTESVHSVASLLLSHHPPEHGHRTIALGCGPWRVRVCSRCSGLACGGLLAYVLLVCDVVDRAPSWLVAGWLLLAPWPALVDFHGQLMRRRESTNARRIATGAVFGSGVCLGIGQAFQGRWIAAAIMPSAFLVYLVWVTAGRRRVARLRRHLLSYAAYFDRCCAEDARAAVSGKRRRVADSRTPL
ncbi:MAG: DUF2085 domain-containing protein [Sedimentisphaerales bacterium]|nr:DUF2085 domain-containing protein [Sedimentisphaerales bacterium]